MPTVDSAVIIGIIGFASVALMNGYAAYWAFGIRRALAVRVYRNQALGVGLVTLGFLPFVFYIFYGSLLSTSWPSYLFPAVPILTAFITMFYWVDASIRAGRRSDPLLRDTLHWSFIRIPLWIAIIGFSAAAIITQVLGVPAWYTLAFVTSFLVIFAPILTGMVFLPIVARRSKDPALRRNLGWFALFATALLIFWLAILSGGANNSGALAEGVASSVAFFIGGYCLYRSAKSLVPLNRLSLD